MTRTMSSPKPFTITIKNNLQLKNIPTEIRQNLMQNLKFFNPKWVENNRMGRWNRGTQKVLRFYERAGGGGLVIPRGYVRQLISLCRLKQVAFQLEDQRRSLEAVDFDFSGRLRSFQLEAVEAMLKKDFGTLAAPTGSGKTVMALYMMAQRRQPALIIVHTRDLAYQWVERIKNFLGIDPQAVGFIGDGKNHIGREITVAMVQSLYKRAETAAEKIGFLLVDECHRCPSRTFTEAVSAFDSRFMLGLSATPYRRDKLSRLIFWHLGDVHHQVDKDRLVKSGDVVPAEVVVRTTAFKPFYDPVYEYSKMLQELTANDERNRLIAADVAAEARASDGVCLVLSDRKRHCRTLQALLRFKHNQPAALLTGDLTSDQRISVLDRLNAGQIKVLVATGQLIGEGFDCQNLTTLFMATPIRFSGRVIQYLGRVLRPAPGKSRAKVYDYVDVHVGPLVASAQARQKVYSSEGGM